MKTNAKAKLAAVATALAMATSMLSVAPMAHAASLTTAQVNSILSLLSSFGADSGTIANVNAALTGAAPSGGSSSGSAMGGSCDVGTANLTIGSTGAAVTALQNALIAHNFSIPAGATGYFGTQTQAAVAAWQKSAGVSPAAGYFGPLSRAAFNLCAPAVEPPAGGNTGGNTGGTGSTALSGNGYLSNITTLGDITADLHSGDGATKVIGVSVDAIDGDVQIQRVDATFTIGSSGSQSSNMDKYVSDISLYLGDTKIASMSPSSGSQSSRTWTYRFSNLSNAIVKQGTTASVYVKVTPVSSVGTNEDGKGATVYLQANSLRAVGGDGISDTYITSSDAVASTGQAFTVSSATTGELTASAATDNPTAGQVTTSSSTKTGVTLLSFNLKAKNSDIKITDLKAALFTTDDNVNDVVNTVYLMKGSTVVSSKTTSTGTYGTITFNNINQTISKGETANYQIVVDLRGQTAALYTDGVTLTASTTATGWTTTDSEGATVNPSAAVTGYAQTLSGTGMSVTLGTPAVTIIANADPATSGSADKKQFSIPFTVTAGDSDIYIAGTTGYNTPLTKIVYATTTTSSASSTDQGTANFVANGTVSGDSAGSYYKVPASTSRVFTLNVTYSSTYSGYTGLSLSSIAYGTGTALGKTYSSNLDTFHTEDVYMVHTP